EVTAYFTRDSGGDRKLVLHRWRSSEALPDATLAAGADFFPLVTMDGRFLILFTQNGKQESVTLHDLASPGKSAPHPLPPFEQGFLHAMAVIGPRLFYIAERPGTYTGSAYVTERRLIALDWASGKVQWSYVLAPRHEAPPVPGGRP